MWLCLSCPIIGTMVSNAIKEKYKLDATPLIIQMLSRIFRWGIGFTALSVIFGVGVECVIPGLQHIVKGC